jgi:hypothetical protein
MQGKGASQEAPFSFAIHGSLVPIGSAKIQKSLWQDLFSYPWPFYLLWRPRTRKSPLEAQASA